MDDNDIMRNQMAQEAERLAGRLTDLASQISWTSSSFTNSDLPAAEIAASIVNEYTQGIGGVGPILWGMIRELSRTK